MDIATAENNSHIMGLVRLRWTQNHVLRKTKDAIIMYR